MNIVEGVLAFLAPHVCLGCGLEGSVLCRGCMYSSLIPLPSRCYRCHKITQQFAVCPSCRRSVKLRRVWLCAEYQNLAKALVKALKFERSKAASDVIADWLDAQLPLIDPGVVVVNVPTANSRVRMRGYDQSKLIARGFAAKRGLVYCEGLLRLGSARQVGAMRKERLQQLERAFCSKNIEKFQGKPVLLVDDVLTTGATIEAAARTLRQAGAKSIEAAVFAH